MSEDYCLAAGVKAWRNDEGTFWLFMHQYQTCSCVHISVGKVLQSTGGLLLVYKVPGYAWCSM